MKNVSALKVVALLVMAVLFCLALVSCAGVQPVVTTPGTTITPTTTPPTPTQGAPEEYTVVFDADNNTAPTELTVKEGETVARPDAPEKEGYIFLGWYLGKAEFDFATPIMENITLKAKWEEIPVPTYTVTFLAYDGTVLSTQTVSEGKSATAPEAPERVGYLFEGWDKDFSAVTEDLTVTACYREKQSYEVVFMNGAEVLSTQKVYEGESAIAPAAPKKEGFVFMGWDVSFEAVESNLTVNAIFAEAFTVTFLDHKGNVIATQTVGKGGSAKAPTPPQRPHYTFTGWDTDYSNVQSDLTVTATYEITTHTVTFNTAGGTVIDSVTVIDGESVARPAEDPVREGYIFVEWQLMGNTYNFNLPVTSSITLVATYKSDGTVPAPTTEEVYIDTGYLELWVDVTLNYQLLTYQLNNGSKVDIHFEALGIEWEFVSTDPAVCTVTRGGSITAHGMGEAKVYAIVTKAGEMHITDTDGTGAASVRTVSLPVGTVIEAVDVKVVDQPDYYKLYLSEENQNINLGKVSVDVNSYASYPTGDYGAGNISLWYGDTNGVFTMTVDDNIMGDFSTWAEWKEIYGIPVTYMVISRYAHEVGYYWREQVAMGQAVQPHGHFHMASSAYGTTSSSKIWMDFYYGKKDVEYASTGPVLVMGYPCGYNDPYISQMLFIAGRGVGGMINPGNSINYNETGSLSGFRESVLTTMEDISNGESLGAWISVHYHNIGSSYNETVRYYEGISSYVKDGHIWAATFPAAAQYGQERDTATLTVHTAEQDVMTFSLTDRMNDLLFTHPLTVRLKADSTWKLARAYQNGKEMPVSIVEKNGETYLLVDAVPDKGEVTVVKTNVPTVSQTENRITYTLTDNVGNHNDKPYTMSFTVDGNIWKNAYATQDGNRLAATLKTENGITTLTVPATVNGGEVVIVPVTDQYSGRTSLSMTEVFRGEVTPDGSIPVTISSAEELAMFSAYVGAGHDCAGVTVVLTCDIDMKSMGNFEPIGWEVYYERSSGSHYYAPFSGTFDGQNHKVTNLTVENQMCMVGFFGYVRNGEIKNLAVEGDVSGRKRVGGLLGHGVFATITNCTFTGTVTNYGLNAHRNTGSMTGGLVGTATSSVIRNCGAYGTVVSYAPSASSHLYDDQGDDFSSGNCTGGLIGSTYWQNKLTDGNTEIHNSVFEGTVIAHKAEDGVGALYVGGFIGDMDTVKIYNSTATATVTGGSYVGGFAGRENGSNRDAFMYNCASHGSVYGEAYVGGLVGHLVGSRRATNHNSFTDATVSAPADALYVGAVFGCLEAGNQNPAPIVYYVPSVNGSMVAYTPVDSAKGISPTCTLTAVTKGEDAISALNSFATANGYHTWISKNGAITPSRFPVHTVTFVDKDGGVIATDSVADGLSATAPEAPAYVGFVFRGWDKAFDAVSANITVKALYDAVETYTVTFYGEDGVTVLHSETVNKGASATAPEAPELADKLFSGWSAEFSSVTSDLSVVAQYTTAYTVTFLGKDGEILKTEKVKAGEGATAPTAPTFEEYRFIGWDKAFDSVTANMTVTARYEQLTLYTVTFLGRDGAVLSTQRVEAGTSATAPAAPALEGYRFTGWDKDFANVQSNLTVNAQYAEVLAEKVTLNIQSWHVDGKADDSFSSQMDAFYAMWGNADIVMYTGTYGVALPEGAEGWAQLSVNNSRKGSVGYGHTIAWRTDKYTYDANAGIHHADSTMKGISDAAAFAVPLVDNATGKQIVVVSVFFGNAAKIHENNRLVNSFKELFGNLTTKYTQAAAIVLNIQTQSTVSGINQGMAGTFSGIDTSRWYADCDFVVTDEYQISGTEYSRYVGSYLTADTTLTVSGMTELPTTGAYATQNGNAYKVTVE